MRAMILAAGLGTRLRPLTRFRAKPALPIRGRPTISILLDVLSRHAVHEVMINLHYLPQTIQKAVEMDCPENMEITWSTEPAPLGTGGGLFKAAEFLKRDPHCVVLAGDMLLDLDLIQHLEAHIESGSDVSLLLRDDPRGADFGTIGLDAGGRVTRIGKRNIGAGSPVATGGEEVVSGLFTGVRLFSRSAFDCPPPAARSASAPREGAPPDPVFEDLRDWLVPAVEAGRLRVSGQLVAVKDSVWEPVGTPTEYLAVNLRPPELPSLGGAAAHWQGNISVRGNPDDVILGARSSLGEGAQLARAVVWEDEEVPAGLHASDGVFAAGDFHAVDRPEMDPQAPGLTDAATSSDSMAKGSES